MGTTRIYFIATVFLFVLNGACLVKGNSTDIVPTLIATTTSYSTSDRSSTSGMNSSYSTSDRSSTSGMNSSYSTSDGSSTSGMNSSYSTSVDSSTSGMDSETTKTLMPADNSTMSNNSDSGITCLVCLGGNSNNCSHASATSSMEDITEQSGCRSCRVSMVINSDTGKGINVTQVERKCDRNDSCPEDVIGEYDYNLNCFHTATYYKCEWCCQKNKCNNFSGNSANALVAAVVLGGWTITKVVYVVVSTVAVAISMSIVV